MLTLKDYLRYQKIFFRRITNSNNVGRVTIKLLTFSNSTDTYKDFVGDNTPEEESFIFGCYYTKNEPEKRKEKEGILDDTTHIVYISPVELFQKTGSYTFPANVMKAKTGISVNFLGVESEVLQIRELEPIRIGGTDYTAAYELQLKIRN